MKALISPIELKETGYRVAQIEQQEFQVAEPLFWVSCANNIIADQFWYDPSDQQIKLIPVPTIDDATNGQNPNDIVQI